MNHSKYWYISQYSYLDNNQELTLLLWSRREMLGELMPPKEAKFSELPCEKIAFL
jgi:hypothetical protein